MPSPSNVSEAKVTDMIIDFDKMEEVAHPQFKGGEGETLFRTFNDGQNKIMRGRLDPGCSIGYHRHEINSEIIYVLSGEARCLYDDGDEPGVRADEKLVPGQCHYCPRGHSHSLINASATEPLLFFAVVPELMAQ